MSTVSIVLRNLKARANLATTRSLTLVSGNQSGDLDSIISSIAYAYLNYKLEGSNTVIPMLNFNKKDLSARKDVELIFKRHDIEVDYLFFSDDLPSLSSKIQDLILVDHNAAQGAVKQCDFKVVGIIDHHVDEGESLNADPRIIAKAGSCSSLVFDYFYKKFANKTDISPEIIVLLLAPLVIDTSNLTSKVEQIDLKVLQIYKDLISPQLPLEILFKQLRTAKDDVSGLSLEQLLNKDYKDFKTRTGKKFGVAAIVKPFEWLEKTFNNGFADGVYQYLNENKLDYLVIMTSFMANGEFHRELGIIEKDKPDFEVSSQAISELKLEGLKEIKTGGSALRLWAQVDTNANRKIVAPLLQEVLV